MPHQISSSSSRYIEENAPHIARNGVALKAPRDQIQPKLFNEKTDAYEQEADAMANQVVAKLSNGSVPDVQAKCKACEEEEHVQRKEEGSPLNPIATSQSGFSEQSMAISGAGQALPDQTRAEMESVFGHNFNQVRVHTDRQAIRMSRQLGAQAFTHGQDIYFNKGKYNPNEIEGQKLLAHELTHVVQQSNGSQTRIQRQPYTRQDLASAEIACDMPLICNIQRAHPDWVDPVRMLGIVRQCRPGAAMSPIPPCLNPAVILPPGQLYGPPPGLGPRRQQTPTAPSASGGGFDLSGLTSFTFNLGPLNLQVNLPSSARIRLPIELRNSRSIVFNMQAETSGNFTFSVTLNGIRDLIFTASTQVAAFGENEGQVTGRLSITTTRQVCQPRNPAATRRNLESKGNALRDAILNLQSPSRIEVEEGESPPDTTELLIEVASAIYEVYDAVKKENEPCRRVPQFSFGAFGRGNAFGDEPGGGSAGLDFTWHF